MTHQDIDKEEMIERYVRGNLVGPEQAAFEEHFFVCDECFEKVQMTERFIAGVRLGARAGLLEGAQPAGLRPWPAWLKPAFAAVAAACLLLALTLTWLLTYRIPGLREAAARERSQREQAEAESRDKAAQLSEQLQGEQQQRAELEKELALAKAGSQPQAPGWVMETNVPLVTLESVREAASKEIVIGPGARSFIVWVEVDQNARFTLYRIEIYDRESRLIQTIKGLRKNSDGGLTAILPARAFQTGKYRLKLYGGGGQQSSLVGEYFLQVQKRSTN